jgi:undecaprenyl-diphosphatase
MSLDTQLFLMIHALTGNPLLDGLMVAAAEGLVFLVPVSLVYLWFQGLEGKVDALYVCAAVVVSIALSYAMGMLYSHQPPSAIYETIAPFEPENAFPSQHTTVAFAAVWPLLWRERTRMASVLAGGAVLTGVARVYIGEHLPLDVAGGLAASAMGLVVLYGVAGLIDDQMYWIAGWFQEKHEEIRARLDSF